MDSVIEFENDASLAELKHAATVPAAIFCVFSWLVLLPDLASAQEAEVVLVLLRGDSELSIVKPEPGEIRLDSESRGLVIWSDGGRENWQFLNSGASWTKPRRASPRADVHALLHGSRGTGSGSNGDVGTNMTAQLVQILGQSVTRGSSFLTPHNGYLLNPRMTIRRQAEGQQPPFPQRTAVLTQGTKEIAQIPFKAGQQKIAYAEIPELVKAHPQGLPPGKYTLRIAGGSESSTFTIDDPDWRDTVMQVPDRFAELTGDRTNSLYLQVAAEYVLDQLDENGASLAYLSDALDLLESVPHEDLSVYLQQLKSDIVKRLAGGKQEAAASLDDPTGVPQIDRARRLIQSGNWRKALAELEAQELADDPRGGGLATLYRAVVLGASGLGTEAEADMTFRQAIDQLHGGPAADRYRAHTNYANFLLNQTQDRLYNHAFQMATGVNQPLLTALKVWRAAREHYDIALELAGELDATQRAGIQVNVARLYVLLADLIRTLDVSPDGSRQFAAGDQAAAARATFFASQAGEDENVEPMIRAASEETQANLAFRARDSEAVLKHADQALVAYLDAGSLVGAEGIHRLLGLYQMRAEVFGREGSVEESRPEALRHLSISRELAELLRERIPADQFGASQAGFFARRAYVNEQLIDLLVQQGKAVEALHIAEAAKARSLQDLLAVQKPATQGEAEEDNESSRPIAELLDQWPDTVAALEYLLGSEKSWLFVIDTKGEVTVVELLPAKNQQTRQLVGEVRRFLNGLEGFGGKTGKMARDLRRGKGFDKTWQDKLHALGQTLIPENTLEKLREADTVLVVPHHILHYFPFAALVTERDEAKRDKFDMVQPRFLIDEPFNLSYAPSLGVWDLLRNRTDHTIKQVSAVGIVDFPGYPALPGVQDDLNNLQSIFKEQFNKVLFAADATEPNIRETLRQPGMILFATHGINLADQPLQSYLMCQQDQTSDGLLTAAELFGTKVRSNLVVLSVCYSGLADRSPLPGDDLFGIQRAFLQSGAQTVVSGLWEVDDGTGPMLMKGFFENLNQGTSAHAALAKSQRAFLEVQRADSLPMYTHPFFWAVYTAAGDDLTRF